MGSIDEHRGDTVQTTLAFRLDPALGGCDDIQVGNTQNLKRDNQNVTIHEISGHEQEFTHDLAGFQFMHHKSDTMDFEDDEAVSSKYYEEVAALAKKVTGATFVHCYMHLLRASRDENRPKTDKFIIPPAHAVHVDYSYDDAPEYIRTSPEQPPDWERLSQSRWAIFSCWRPMNKITRDALCVGDKRTVPDSDLVNGSTDMPVPGRKRKTGLMMVNHNPEHRYYYKKQMGPEDVLWIKLYDSKLDGRARCSPHSAFNTSDDYGEARQSIETRCIAVWEGEELH